MARLRKKPDERVGIPIAPMIDCVFLLLIYFMLSSTLEKQEADLSFELPGTVEQVAPLEFPDEQIIEIRDDGQAVVNDYAYDRPDSPSYQELAAMLARYQSACRANQSEARVTLSPADGTAHQAVVKVMDACARAGVNDVQFAR
ncbi:biopolymer transporter ExbD [Ruficoccus amylovorans]|uniref:Biopolymer transporter ExbD n=1 Tax=Ruficoccus amylovorans TaxID=1804625 RepID=A0A842HH53_9BACT|nr:biopolymer transporter ExbD [Ruficoccus amylovorans]MBC2595328.1 biopolymer transporter ExbD [Ruficoccus amylovorans]